MRNGENPKEKIGIERRERKESRLRALVANSMSYTTRDCSIYFIGDVVRIKDEFWVFVTNMQTTVSIQGLQRMLRAGNGSGKERRSRIAWRKACSHAGKRDQ